MTTYRVQIRQRMNILLERATDLSQLLEDACSLGVTIDLRGKHTTYHFGAQQRKTRANKLSDDDRFTKEGLEERITRNKGFVDFLESTIECFRHGFYAITHPYRPDVTERRRKIFVYRYLQGQSISIVSERINYQKNIIVNESKMGIVQFSASLDMLSRKINKKT